MIFNDHRRVRRGFSLIELLVGIVIFAIIGSLCTKLMTTQGRYFDRQGMGATAPSTMRASFTRPPSRRTDAAIETSGRSKACRSRTSS